MRNHKVKAPPLTSSAAQDAPSVACLAMSTETPFDTPFDAPAGGPAQGSVDDPWGDDPEAGEAGSDDLVLDIDGYEGPLDMLLDLARRQKVDLRKISIVELVDQYLAFISALTDRKLEIAADYLVMAAWLTYLKAKLLVPAPKDDTEDPSGEEMAARLAFQLQRLEAMRDAAEKLFALPQKNVDFFARGAPEGVTVHRVTEWSATLYDLLRAYTAQRVGNIDRVIQYEAPRLLQIEEARLRLSAILGEIPDWSDLMSLSLISSPIGGEIDAPRASVIASSFNAVLELAKAGKIDLRQGGAFEPVYLRRRQMTAPPGDLPNVTRPPDAVT